MSKQQIIFTPSPNPYNAPYNATVCAPNGTNVVNTAITTANNLINPALLSAPSTPGEPTIFPLTLPTLNGLGNGIVLPQGGSDGGNFGVEGADQGQNPDLMIINASDYQLYLAFGDLGNISTNTVGPNSWTGPTVPVGPQVAGCFIVPPQTTILLTTNTAVLAVAGNNSQVFGGAVALAAQGANYASIFSNGNVGTVTFARGFASVQYVF